MVFLNGDAISDPGPRGERITDDSFLLCFNAHHEPITFTLPGPEFGQRWEIVVDTATPMIDAEDQPHPDAGGALEVEARSLHVLRRVH